VAGTCSLRASTGTSRQFATFPNLDAVGGERTCASVGASLAGERRTARDLIPIRERSFNHAVDVLVQEVAALREARCGIGHKPLIVGAVLVALLDRQARIMR